MYFFQRLNAVQINRLSGPALSRTMGTQGGPERGIQIKENMYGDAIVDLETAKAAESFRIADDMEEISEPGGMRKTGSWRLTNKEGHGMHVTFQVV